VNLLVGPASPYRPRSTWLLAFPSTVGKISPGCCAGTNPLGFVRVQCSLSSPPKPSQLGQAPIDGEVCVAGCKSRKNRQESSRTRKRLSPAGPPRVVAGVARFHQPGDPRQPHCDRIANGTSLADLPIASARSTDCSRHSSRNSKLHRGSSTPAPDVDVRLTGSSPKAEARIYNRISGL